MLDFVQRTRVERMKGFITVYREVEVENEFSTIHDEYFKYFGKDSKASRESTEVVLENESDNHNLSAKKFIDNLLKEIQESAMTEYF